MGGRSPPPTKEREKEEKRERIEREREREVVEEGSVLFFCAAVQVISNNFI